MACENLDTGRGGQKTFFDKVNATCQRIQTQQLREAYEARSIAAIRHDLQPISLSDNPDHQWQMHLEALDELVRRGRLLLERCICEWQALSEMRKQVYTTINHSTEMRALGESLCILQGMLNTMRSVLWVFAKENRGKILVFHHAMKEGNDSSRESGNLSGKEQEILNYHYTLMQSYRDLREKFRQVWRDAGFTEPSTTTVLRSTSSAGSTSRMPRQEEVALV